MEIATVEVKPTLANWERQFFEAVSHRRFANRSYFAFELHGYADFDRSGFDNPIKPSGAPGFLYAAGEVRHAAAMGEFPAWLANLGDLQEYRSGAEYVANADTRLSEPARRNILTEKWGLFEVGCCRRQLGLPEVIVLERVVMDGFLRTAVVDGVAVRVACGSFSAHAKRASHTFLSDRTRLAVRPERVYRTHTDRIDCRSQHSASYTALAALCYPQAVREHVAATGV